MSSYFDEADRTVRNLSQMFSEGGHCLDEAGFVAAVMAAEDLVAKDCELFAGDLETPEDVRQAIMAVIAIDHIRCPYDSLCGIEDPGRFAVICQRSRFLANMHSLFHDIGRMRYTMRYGLVMDDPGWAVQQRDRWVEERDKTGAPHPWQTAPPSEKLPLVIREAPSYCRTVVEWTGKNIPAV